MAKKASKSFSLGNFSQYSPYFAVSMCALYDHPIYLMLKRKYQQYGLCFQTIFPLLLAVLKKYLTFTTYYSFPQKHNLKTTYRNKHNKKQLKISHTYTNNNRSSTYLTLHQSMTLLPTSSHNNNIYKCLNYRDLYNFPPSHLP